MPVINSLALDHFYISLPEAKFNKYMDFFNDLSGRHEVVKSSDDQWEGLYLHSRIRDYFEILKDRRPGGLGVALSPVNPAYTEVGKIIDENLAFSWHQGVRLDSKKNPWFSWFSLNDYLDIETVPFNFWIMEYSKNHIDYPQRPKPKMIDDFRTLNLQVGSKYKAEILSSLQFTDYTTEQKNLLKIEIPKKDGWPFTINITFVDSDIKFQPQSLTFKTFNFNTELLAKYDFITIQNEIVNLTF